MTLRFRRKPFALTWQNTAQGYTMRQRYETREQYDAAVIAVRQIGPHVRILDMEK